MPAKHRIIIIAQPRPFDAERWRQLLTALAYVLHERRTGTVTPPVPQPPDGGER